MWNCVCQRFIFKVCVQSNSTQITHKRQGNCQKRGQKNRVQINIFVCPIITLYVEAKKDKSFAHFLLASRFFGPGQKQVPLKTSQLELHGALWKSLWYVAERIETFDHSLTSHATRIFVSGILNLFTLCYLYKAIAWDFNSVMFMNCCVWVSFVKLTFQISLKSLSKINITKSARLKSLKRSEAN